MFAYHCGHNLDHYRMINEGYTTDTVLHPGEARCVRWRHQYSGATSRVLQYINNKK